MEQPTNIISEFQVVLLLKKADGKDVVYRSPVYKSADHSKLGPALLEMVMVRRLHEWITAALKEEESGKGHGR